DVHLDVVGLPLIGDRFDADARHADLGAAVPDPRVHRLPHLGVVGLLREDVLAVVTETAGQVDCHCSPRGVAPTAHRIASVTGACHEFRACSTDGPTPRRVRAGGSVTAP